MNTTTYTFPVFRKYIGIEVWFKILSPDAFIEIKKVGKQFVVSEIKATIYPEKTFIQDMLSCYEDRWEEINEADYILIEEKIKGS